jgi:hypothetical protein
MHTAISASAKAETPFGPLAGRTPVHVTDAGADSVVITFHCGPTPVTLVMAGEHYLAFVRACIAHAADESRPALTEALAGECAA